MNFFALYISDIGAKFKVSHMETEFRKERYLLESVKVQLQKNNYTLSNRDKSIVKDYLNNKSLILMLLPAIIYYIIFRYIPIYGVIISFKEFRILDGIMASPWAGLKYFNMAFQSTDFWRAFSNTLILSGMKLLINFPAPIILALLLNEVKNLFFKRVVQTISYMPHFLSWVVLSGIVIAFLSPSTGSINMILVNLGIKPIYFLGNEGYFRYILVFSSMWKDVGWGTIVYLAALNSVDLELYEAAVLDGANRFKQTIHVTLPAISPMIVIMFIFAVGAIVNDDFDQIYNLYNPAVYSVGEVLSTYIYKVGLEKMQYSYAAAVGLFKNVIAFMLVLLTNNISKRFSDYGLW